MRGKIKAYKLFVGKSEEKRPPGKHTLGLDWDDNIKLDSEGTRLGCMDWIHLDEDKDQ
jgi:hypothetical protein